MTEKRFTKQEVYEGINRYKINESNFIVEVLDDGIPMHYSTIVNRLNEQHETIQSFRKAEVLANHRGEMISFANALIDDLGSETMRKMWNEFKEEKYREWRDLE